LPVRGWLKAPVSPQSPPDVLVLFHPTIEEGTPQSAAQKFLELSADSSKLNLGSFILFSCALVLVTTEDHESSQISRHFTPCACMCVSARCHSWLVGAAGQSNVSWLGPRQASPRRQRQVGGALLLIIYELQPIDLHVLLGCSRCFDRSHFLKTLCESTACRYAEAALQWAMASGGGLNDYLNRNSACVRTRCGCAFLCFNISVSFRFAEIVGPRVNVWAFARHGGG
jgi:hypothetical protein